MATAIGVLVPWVLVALAGLRRDSETQLRFYIAPAIVAVLGMIAVLTADAGNTPEFWVGICAGLAGVVGAGLALVVQSFTPLDWWTRHSHTGYPITDDSAASSSGRSNE